MSPDEKKRRLERLSETVRTGYKKEDLDKIISKLKPKDEEAGGARNELDFAHVDLGGGAPVELIDKFYSLFAGPVEVVAKFLAKFPIAKQLEKNLAASRLKFNVESYLVMAAVLSFFAGVFGFIVSMALFFEPSDPLSFVISVIAFVFVFVICAMVVLIFPASRASDFANAVDKSLPFALRQLSTQLKAGFSFYKPLHSLSKSDYGALSEAIELVLRDLDSGLSTEEALKLLMKRNRSEGLRKAILQIIRAMRTGGSLSVVISEIADDVSFETRQKIRDFTEKLNFVNILYVMVGVVMPVAVAILSAIMQIPLFAGAIPSWFVYAGFGISLAFITVMLYATQKMEPAAW